MKLSANQMQYLAEKVFLAWKEQNILTCKVDEKKIISRLNEAIKANYQQESNLEIEVNAMLDQLEKSNPGEFQRSKMFHMLKQKLAKDKRIVL